MTDQIGPVGKMISKNGHSLTLNITWEAKALGLDWGDKVIVILRRPDDGDTKDVQ